MRELARRLMSCPGWRWTGGMRCKDSGWRWRDGYLFAMDGTGDFIETAGGCVPNLRDPATLGCLLALVREAHGEQCIHTTVDHEGWSVVQRQRPRDVWGRFLADGCNTEAEALGVALEAASCES